MPGLVSIIIPVFNAGKRAFIPEEVAEVLNFLLSDFSGCISGEIITCDQATWVVNWPE